MAPADIAMAILFTVTAVPLAIWGVTGLIKDLRYYFTYKLPGDDVVAVVRKERDDPARDYR